MRSDNLSEAAPQPEESHLLKVALLSVMEIEFTRSSVSFEREWAKETRRESVILNHLFSECIHEAIMRRKSPYGRAFPRTSVFRHPEETSCRATHRPLHPSS
jgi:hypothetical protein